MHIQNLVLSSISLDNVSRLWEENDIIIFLVDMDNYNMLSNNTLGNTASIMEYFSDTEKENLEKFQTLHFKKRFIVSRIVLKHILCRILDNKSVLEISTYKKGYGEVHICNHEGLHICIAYSANIISLAISKVKLGIDIEIRRPLKIKNTLKYLQKMPSYPHRQANNIELLTLWTMKEAYCKFSGRSMLLNLSKELNANDIFISNYILDYEYIFSIVTDPNPYSVNISHLEKISY